MSIDIANYAKNRFTSKAYDSSKKLTKGQIQQIKDLLRFAPSSVNSQPWHFILATSEEAKAKIAKSAENIHAKNVANIKNSSLVIVLCIKTDVEEGYLQKLLLQEKKDGRFPNLEFEEMQGLVRKKFIELHKYELKDLLHWMEKQVYINLGNTLLGIAALGLNATPMEGIEAHIVDEQFSLKEKGYMTSLVVTVGYNSDQDFNANLPK